jgi:hypothetical protein
MLGRELPDGFEVPQREFYYFQLADRFGWTPTQIDEQPGALLDWLLAIGQVKAEVVAEQKESYGRD